MCAECNSIQCLDGCPEKHRFTQTAGICKECENYIYINQERRYFNDDEAIHELCLSEISASAFADLLGVKIECDLNNSNIIGECEHCCEDVHADEEHRRFKDGMLFLEECLDGIRGKELACFLDIELVLTENARSA